MPTTSTDAFVPCRGLEEDIASLAKVPYIDGRVYFAYDTNKIFFDAKGERHVMSGDGITFVYGNDPAPIQNAEILTDYTLLISAVNDGNPVAIDNIIINQDGGFYRVTGVTADGERYECNLMAIAGSGGGTGGGGTGRILRVTTVNAFPLTTAKGYDIEGVFKCTSNFGDETVTIEIEISSNDRLEPIIRYQDVTVGEEYTVKIAANELLPGDNVIRTRAVVDEDASAWTKRTVNVLNIGFAATSTWNPRQRFGESWNDIDFSYKLSNLPADGSVPVTIYYYFDDLLTATQITKVDSGNYKFDKNTELGGLGHGDHDLRVEAYASINDLSVKIGTLRYNIMWVQDGNLSPIIVSNYYSAEEKNYSIINIPYMVYDPASTTDSAEVFFYINGEEVSTGSQIIPYSSTTYANWEINQYNAEEVNTFTLACGTTQKVFEVMIVRDSTRNLDPIAENCLLYLTSFGRSNSESSMTRAVWKNGIGDKLDSGTTFTGFNWYNNGWIRDEDNYTALRLSNGAEISIPLAVMETQNGRNLTFEIEFKIRNTLEYSKLVYITMEEVKDKDGKPVYDEDGNVKTEPVKHISTGVGVVGSYLGNNIGLCIGAQETYFKGSNKIVNVSYPDEERVKISVVLNVDAKRLYIYINGVLTGVESYTTGEDFGSQAKALTFNSEHCDIDIYNIRVYTSALNYTDIVQNWVGDAPDLNVRLSRYDWNNITSENEDTGEVYIDYTKTMASGLIPVMTIKTYSDDITGEAKSDMLPYAKGIKKCCGVRYYDPANPSKNFHGQNFEIDVQGTSSQGYPRRNYKLKTKVFNEDILDKLPFHIQHWDGREVTKFIFDGEELPDKKYDLGHGIRETTFCLKADYMESSSTHNTGMANYINRLSRVCGSFDFRHPLVQNETMTSCRTTIYGFPILLFHENAAGDITFVGKYNFNIDKGATDSFGFTNKTKHPFVSKVKKLDAKKNGNYTEDEEDATYKNVAECWELKNNQSGGRATFQLIDWNSTDDDGELNWLSDFEARYHIADWDPDDIYEAAGTKAEANAKINSYTTNFAKLCAWINSTDTSDTRPVETNLPAPVYYRTRDTEYDPDIEYYANIGDAEPVKVNFTYAASTETKGITLDADTFLAKIGAGVKTDDEAMGTYSFALIDNAWLLNNEAVVLAEYGISLSDVTLTNIDIVASVVNDWDARYYERFTTDSNRYRLAKFKNEFNLHLNRDYCLIYAIMTEFLIMYDSRAKNMMLASWGPEATDGEYIWYPIFYDMDTQLGVNNSGVVYWDYGTNPTPDDPTQASIYSGQASVLWNNFTTCFLDEMKLAYRALRQTGGLNYEELVTYYDTMQADKWSEIMKNMDAFYKYIAPSDPAYGFINQGGELAFTDTFFYCLQGDRTLNRDLFFRNRLNYMDSKWQGGTYNRGTQGGANIQMRYNANDGSNTSDTGIMSDSNLDANATFDLRPYLTQYCMVFYDEAVTTPVRFDVDAAKDTDVVSIEPIPTIKTKINSATPFTQQLAYVYGPEYISDLGDLSKKYLNEFFAATAKRLRTLKVGSEYPGYMNKGLTDKNFSLNSAAYLTDSQGNQHVNTNAKSLLQELDISNLSGLSANLDISGCTKLKILKALGTNLTSVAIPSGNIIERMYLPSTINSIELIEPQALTSLIEDKADASYGNNKDGLYIEGLTDKLGETAGADDITKINRYVIENTLLKYDTYRILKRLYDVKVQMQNSATLDTTKYSRSLLLSLEKVDWTPYKRVEEGSLYDSKTTYYIRNDQMTYSTYEYNVNTWNNDLMNVGVYTKEDKESIVENLDMIDTFIDMYTSGSGVSSQYFRSIHEDASGATKRIVPMSGNIHVNNSASNPLDEAELYNKYSYHYPDLTITANNVTECYRVKFLEQLDGRQTLHGLQKVSRTAGTFPTLTYTGIAPTRLHYDFLGWSKPEKTAAIMANNSIGTIDDVVDLSTLTLNQNYTLCAVFAIHSYTVVFKNWDDTEILNPGNQPIKIPSGGSIVPPTVIPYRDSSTLELTQTYYFLGYGYNDGTNDVVDLSAIKVYRENLTYYAKYEQRSVYQSVTPESALVLYPVAGDSSGALSVGLNPDAGLKGKICIPKQGTYQGALRNITTVRTASTTSGVDANGFAGNANITHIFFEGGDDGTSVIQAIDNFALRDMANLEYVDFPDSLIAVRQSACLRDYKLSFPSTNKIITFGQQCFNGTNMTGTYPTLQIAGNIMSIGQGAFLQAGWKAISIGSSDDPCPLGISDIGNGGYRTFGGTNYSYGGTQAYTLDSFTIYSNQFTSTADLKNLLHDDPAPSHIEIVTV